MASRRLLTPASYMFVEVNDATHEPRVLAHHKREARRQKNLRVADLYHASMVSDSRVTETARGTSPRILEVNKDFAVPHGHRRPPNAKPETPPFASRKNLMARNGEGKDDERTEERDTSRSALIRKNTSLATIFDQNFSQDKPTGVLGAGRVDPFSVFPFDAGRGSQILVDHC